MGFSVAMSLLEVEVLASGPEPSGKMMSRRACLVSIGGASVARLASSSTEELVPSFSDNGFWPGFQWVGGGLSDLRNIGLLIMRNRLASASRLRRLMSEPDSEELDNDRPLRVRTGDMRSRRPSLRGGLLRRPKLSCLPNTRLSGDIRRLRSAERDRDLLLSTEPEFLLSSRDLADCRRSGE